jgi:predicted ATPase
MLTSIKFKQDWEKCFLKNQKFTFKPITLMVGDQGVGKSTMLSVIRHILKTPDSKAVEFTTDDTKQGGLFSMDMEKDNPRTGSLNAGDAASYKSSFLSNFGSHGEALKPILRTLDTISDSFILLDEPETALSLRTQFLMIECFKNALTRNNQIIVATHNLVFMEAFPESILSLEHGKYLTPKKFVISQKGTTDFKDKRDDKFIKKYNCEKGISCTCLPITGGWFKNTCDSFIGRDGVSNRIKKLKKTF